MKKGKYLLFVFFILVIVLCKCSVVYAGPDLNAIDTLQSAFETGLDPIAEKLKSAAESLFMMLALMQFIWSSYQIVLDGKFELQSWCMSIIKTIIYISVFRIFVVFGYGYLDKIGKWISAILGDNSSGISTMLSSVFSMADAPKNALAKYMESPNAPKLGVTEIANDLKYLGALFVTWLGGLVIAGIMCIAFINAVYVKIKLYVVTCFSIFALGFGGLTYSKDIAINGIKKVISASVELMVIYALISCAKNVFSYFETYQITDFGGAFTLTSLCIVAALVFMIMFKSLPGDISSMFGGGGGGGGGSLVAAAGAVMGAAASLSHVAGKIAGGAATGARAAAGLAGAIKEKGLGGATKEAISNRYLDWTSGAKNSVLGRNKDNNYGKDYVSPPGGGGTP